jgi:Tfp pilus assembly protein PilW
MLMRAVPRRGLRRARQSGLSIVELMVGVTIGLIVVAAASLLMSFQLIENRRLLTETQLQQDLRGAADIMTRELRRAGTREEVFALGTVWYPGSPNTKYNAYPAFLAASAGQIDFKYDPGSGSASTFGYKLEGGVIKTNLSDTWQDLTDANVMRVQTAGFTPTLTPANATAIKLPCPKLCADGTTDCWPSYQVRDVELAISAEARSDPAVTRSIRSKVRLRGDRINFADAASNLICPA